MAAVGAAVLYGIDYLTDGALSDGAEAAGEAIVDAGEAVGGAIAEGAEAVWDGITDLF